MSVFERYLDKVRANRKADAEHPIFFEGDQDRNYHILMPGDIQEMTWNRSYNEHRDLLQDRVYLPGQENIRLVLTPIGTDSLLIRLGLLGAAELLYQKKHGHQRILMAEMGFWIQEMSISASEPQSRAKLTLLPEAGFDPQRLAEWMQNVGARTVNTRLLETR